MKYYTFEWWSGEGEDDPPHPYGDYSKRIEEIEGKLPESVKRFLAEVSMHDSRIETIEIDLPTNSIKIIAWGYESASSSIEYELRYAGVLQYRTSSNPEKGFTGVPGYGDWGYDEFDLYETDRFMHSILFSSGIEMVILFKEFDFEQRSVQKIPSWLSPVRS